jgi:dipeptidase E
MQESGFAEKLPGVLRDTVYFGISAGSTMLTPGQNYDPERLESEGIYYDDEFDEPAPRGAGSAWGMGLVDFSIRPHLGADYFPVAVDMAMMERAAARLDHPMYAIDDETAIKVVDGTVEVVSEGEWRYFEG